MPLALQSVFHMLQFTDIAVDTHDLTKSFGWDVGDAFQQHDAQEFNRILCDRLDEVMKGTKVEGDHQQAVPGTLPELYRVHQHRLQVRAQGGVPRPAARGQGLQEHLREL